MILIREVQKPTLNTALLEDIKQGNSLGDGKTVIMIAVDDKMRRRELADLFGGGGIKATVVFTGIPDSAHELVGN